MFKGPQGYPGVEAWPFRDVEQIHEAPKPLWIGSRYWEKATLHANHGRKLPCQNMQRRILGTWYRRLRWDMHCKTSVFGTVCMSVNRKTHTEVDSWPPGRQFFAASLEFQFQLAMASLLPDFERAGEGLKRMQCSYVFSWQLLYFFRPSASSSTLPGTLPFPTTLPCSRPGKSVVVVKLANADEDSMLCRAHALIYATSFMLS